MSVRHFFISWLHQQLFENVGEIFWKNLRNILRWVFLFFLSLGVRNWPWLLCLDSERLGEFFFVGKVVFFFKLKAGKCTRSLQYCLLHICSNTVIRKLKLFKSDNSRNIKWPWNIIRAVEGFQVSLSLQNFLVGPFQNWVDQVYDICF